MRSDDRTFAAIVSTYTEPLYWHIRRLVVSHEDAQDVLQDTFIKAFRHLWTLRDESSLRPWLYKIATNESYKCLKKRHDTSSLSVELESQLMSSEHVNFTNNAEIKLQKALIQMTPQQKTVFCLRYYDEMDYQQISEITGHKESVLRVAYHNAREKIKNFIENE